MNNVTQIREVKSGQFGRLEGVVDVPLFGRTVSVYIDDGGSVAFAQKCADYLNSLPARVIDDTCAASIRYCVDCREAIGEPQDRFDNPRDVLQMVRPSVLIVPDLPDDSEPIIHMELNCDWEEEHGMEWIIRDDRPQYVGPWNGEYPMADFTKKDAWNFA